MSNITGTAFNFRKLKKTYKIPMIMMALMGALIGGLTNTLLKTCTLIYNIEGEFTLGLSFTTALTLGVAYCQIMTINKAMEFYD